jgi:hypothetical protein
MADEKVIGGGVGGLNTGNSGINDGDIGSGGNTGGGGAASTSGASVNSTTSGTSGTSGNTPDSTEGMSDAELVESVVTKYLAASGFALTYELLVPIYVDNKLGFAELKKQYKKDNPDVDPAEVDKAVDEERQSAIDEFNNDDSTAKDELKKKYDDFKISLATIKKDLSSIVKEFGKTVGEAFMPTTIGLGAPNPLSITLKLYNGLTKIKKILDRVFAALSVFMASAKALGLDDTEGYNSIISGIAAPLRVIQNLIAKQESDASYQEDLALQDYLQTAKENWPAGQSLGIDYETVEGYGKDGISYSGGGENKTLTISMWPIEDPKDRQQLVGLIGNYKKYNTQLPSGVGIYDGLIFKMEAMLTYNDYLGWASKEFKKYYKQLADTNENNNSTDTPSIPSYDELSSSGTSGSGGGNGNNNTGNLIQKFTRALFKRING